MKKLLFTLVFCGFFAAAGAQTLMPRGFFHIDWQGQMIFDNNFADKASGWGVNFEAGYYASGHWGLGAFICYQTHNEYFPRQTINLPEGPQMTTDQQHSLYQVPFGITGRYRFGKEKETFEPYLSMKAGPSMVRFVSYYSTFDSSDRTWGFYLSPELGMTVYPTSDHLFGIHLSVYYSYATNNTDLMGYNVSSVSNMGLRVGIAF